MAIEGWLLTEAKSSWSTVNTFTHCYKQNSFHKDTKWKSVYGNYCFKSVLINFHGVVRAYILAVKESDGAIGNNCDEELLIK